MAEQKPSVIFENLLKAYKADYEGASNPLVKTQAKQKANKLREMASLFGIEDKAMAMFSPDVKLKDTPGGQSIDYGALAQTGKLWAGMTGEDPQSIAKRGIGQAIVTGLPKFGRTAGAGPSEQAAYGKFLGGASDVIAAGAARLPETVVPGAEQAQRPGAIPGGIQPLPNYTGGPAQPTQLPNYTGGPAKLTPLSNEAGGGTGIPPVVPTPSVSYEGQGAMGASQAQAIYDARQPLVNEAGDEVPLEPVVVGASNTTMKAYVEAGDFNGWITSQPWCPVITDASGKKTPDYVNFKAGDWAAWSNQLTLFGNAAALVDSANGSYTNLEDQPGWKEYMTYMDVDLQARLDNAKSAFDNTSAHYANAQASIGAREKVALAGIQNVLNISMWKSRQSLAATGMVFSGLLAWGYQQGMFQAQQASAEVIIGSSEAFNNIAIDLATLGADYELEKKNSKNAQIAEIALERYKWLYGENEEYLAAKKALDGAMSALGIGAQAAPGIIAGTNQAATAEATAAAAKAALEDSRWWITTAVSALEHGITVGQNADGSVTLSQGLTAKERADLEKDGYIVDENGRVTGKNITTEQIAAWLEQGIIYDPKAGTLTHKMTPSEQETNRHNIETERIDALTQGQQVARDAETKRHNGVLETLGGAGETTDAGPFGTGYTQDQFDNDLKLIDKGTTLTQKGYASLSLSAGTGAGVATDRSFGEWLVGLPSGPLLGMDGKPVTDANGKVVQMNASLGFLMLSESDQKKLVDVLPRDKGFIATVAGYIQRELLNTGTPVTAELLLKEIMEIGGLDATGKPVMRGGGSDSVGGKGAQLPDVQAAAFDLFSPEEQQRIMTFLSQMFVGKGSPSKVEEPRPDFLTWMGGQMNGWSYGGQDTWHYNLTGEP